eukprot:PLAT15156.1.p1 GENE.PLAT15156.1~~PLAT15156.1.p1  ORF type:complete len:411 (+),score=169.70 PLAT15156.1:135-1235(+)
MAAVASKAALSAAGLSADKVDSVFVGNVAQVTADGPYLARHVGLKAGVPEEVPALTVNRLCGSGFQALVSGAQDIMLGESSIALTGGAESMSLAPFVLRDSRFGSRALGVDLQLKDALWECLTDSYCGMPMALTAEKLAEAYDIGREEVDVYSARSQELWEAAAAAGAFDAEIAPMTVKVKRKEVEFKVDEHPRPGTTAESLSTLPPLFKKDGIVHAGSASGISDGAGAIVLAGEEAVAEHGLTPLARVVDYAIVGVDPSIMGIGPAPAIKKLLARTGLTVEDIDLVEVNEAFAAQYLAVEKDVGLIRDRTNVCGGAIAIGHPTGASGSRIMGHLAHRLQATDSRYGLGAACIGGGQGIAVLIEKA